MCEFNILAIMGEPGHARGDHNLSWESSRWLLIHLPHHSRQFSPGPEPGQLPYFYDDAARCNKRAPGSGCDAVSGLNRMHAILGASEACIATHPSDMCVALAALDATVQITGPYGDRAIAVADFHRLPG